MLLFATLFIFGVLHSSASFMMGPYRTLKAEVVNTSCTLDEFTTIINLNYAAFGVLFVRGFPQRRFANTTTKCFVNISRKSRFQLTINPKYCGNRVTSVDDEKITFNVNLIFKELSTSTEVEIHSSCVVAPPPLPFSIDPQIPILRISKTPDETEPVALLKVEFSIPITVGVVVENCKIYDGLHECEGEIMVGKACIREGKFLSPFWGNHEIVENTSLMHYTKMSHMRLITFSFSSMLHVSCQLRFCKVTCLAKNATNDKPKGSAPHKSGMGEVITTLDIFNSFEVKDEKHHNMLTFWQIAIALSTVLIFLTILSIMIKPPAPREEPDSLFRIAFGNRRRRRAEPEVILMRSLRLRGY